MTTVLSKEGQIILPERICEKLQLAPGDDFEVQLEDDGTITLRRISRPPNGGLVDLLLGCPSPFEIPERDTDETALLAL